MKLPFFGKTDTPKQADSHIELQEDDADTMDTGTKIKVVAALLVVGIATYVAYWVQEPSNVKVDVLGSTQEEIAQSDETANENDDTTNEAEDAILQDESLLAQSDLPATDDDMLTLDEEALDEAMLEDEEEEDAEAAILQAQAQENTGLKQEEVDILDFAFSPANLTIEEGTVLIWSNKDSVPHTVTAESFSSGTLNPGESFSYTFDRAGTYEYTCSFHPQMKGQITVQAEGDMNSMLETMTLEESLSSNPQDDMLLLNTQEVTPLTLEAAHTAAMTPEDQAQLGEGSLTKSGPEELLYLAALGTILWLYRKRLFS